MGLRRLPPDAALVVPDDETWLVCAEPSAAGEIEPTSEPGRARVLMVPDRVPAALADAVAAAWRAMPPEKSVRTYSAELPGVSTLELLAGVDDSRDEGSTDSDEQDGEDEHDHGDMMAITGEPSADGLVMEHLDVRAGPLGLALPGGLVVTATLDGDVVAQCEVQGSLEADGTASPGDYATAVAWSVAEASAGSRPPGAPGDRWLRLAAVELEHAVAHLAWLHAFGRLLGWQRLTERVRALLRDLRSARSPLPDGPTAQALADASLGDLTRPLHASAEGTSALASDLAGSRPFGRRTSGLGAVSADEAHARGLTGPVARASGVPADPRAADPAYAALGFEPLVRDDGDARARALLRTAEAARSLELAAGAIVKADASDEPAPVFGVPPTGVVESARGPVRVTLDDEQRVERTMPGAAAARTAAGELAVGREWAGALVTIASFDVSPWRPAG